MTDTLKERVDRYLSFGYLRELANSNCGYILEISDQLIQDLWIEVQKLEAENRELREQNMRLQMYNQKYESFINEAINEQALAAKGGEDGKC